MAPVRHATSGDIVRRSVGASAILCVLLVLPTVLGDFTGSGGAWTVSRPSAWSEHERAPALVTSNDGAVAYLGSLAFIGNESGTNLRRYALNVTAYSTSDGSVVWQRQYFHPTAGSYFKSDQDVVMGVRPAGGGIVVIVDSRSTGSAPQPVLYYLDDATGGLKWSRTAPSVFPHANLVVRESDIVVMYTPGTRKGHMFVTYDLGTGQPIKQTCTNSPTGTCADWAGDLAVVGDIAYVATSYGANYPYASSARVVAYDLRTGGTVWTEELPKKGAESLLASRIEQVGSKLVVSGILDQGGGGRVLAMFVLSASTGQLELARSPLRGDKIWTAPAMITDGGNVVVAGGAISLGGSSFIVAFNATTGKIDWESRYATPDAARSKEEAFLYLAKRQGDSRLFAVGTYRDGGNRESWIHAEFDASDGTLLSTLNRTSWQFTGSTQDSVVSVIAPSIVGAAPGGGVHVSPGAVGPYDYVVEGRPATQLNVRPSVVVAASRPMANLGQSATYSIVAESDPNAPSAYAAWEWDGKFELGSGPLTRTFSTPGAGCATRRIIATTGVSASDTACVEVSDRLLLNISTHLDQTFRTPRLLVLVSYESGGPAPGVMLNFADSFRADDPTVQTLQQRLGCDRTRSTYNTGPNGRAIFELALSSRCSEGLITQVEFAGEHRISLSGRDAAGNSATWTGVIRTANSFG